MKSFAVQHQSRRLNNSGELSLMQSPKIIALALQRFNRLIRKSLIWLKLPRCWARWSCRRRLRSRAGQHIMFWRWDRSAKRMYCRCATPIRRCRVFRQSGKIVENILTLIRPNKQTYKDPIIMTGRLLIVSTPTRNYKRSSRLGGNHPRPNFFPHSGRTKSKRRR